MYVVSKFVMGKVPVFTVLFLRYLISGIVLFVILVKRNPSKINRQDYKCVFYVGFLGYFLSTGAQLLGTKLSSASLGSLVNSLNPITITVFSAIILKEKLTLKRAICIILALTGVCIIIGDVNGSTKIMGIAFSVLSVVLWSFVSIIVRQITQKYSSFQITVYGIIIAIVFTLPVSVYELLIVQNVQFDLKVALSLVYIGLVCTALAHVLWNKSLSMVEAGTCSMFYPIQPLVAALFGWIF
ncbi:MAG TPA: EamA family transporter [Bacillota bacterium]|nr:EamA family transporter [Bacillota bacterium]